MGFNMIYIFSVLLLVSVSVSCYDQGLQNFYEVSSDLITSVQNENREVILYLTPDQVNSLEENGAVVRSAEDSENEEADAGFSEPQLNEDQSEETEQDEDEESQQEEEAQEEEQDIDFEEILRILNEQQVEEEDAEEPQVEEENTESPRNFSPRITLSQSQQQQKAQRYVAPAVAKRDQLLKSYSCIHYQPNEQPQRINFQLLQQQHKGANNAKESNLEQQMEAINQEIKKYKLVPYEVEEIPEVSVQEENSEQQAQSNGTPLLNAERLTEAIVQRKNRLLQNELRLQGILRELKASPKHNDEKYAIEIERLRANLEKQNALSKAEAIAKAAPFRIMQQLNKKRRLNKFGKQGKAPYREIERQRGKPQQPKFRKTSAPAENAIPIRLPVIKGEKAEVPRPIPVPVETGRHLSVKNVYVKTRTEKPFIVSRRVPEDKRQSPAEVSSKPERITILIV